MRASSSLVLILIIAVIALSLLAAHSPQDYATADNQRLLAQPTATYAALKNHEAALYVTVVAPVQAAAQAKSIMARTEQQIAEDKHQEALRYQGAMNELNLSNTLQLNTLDVAHTAQVESIKAHGAKEVMDATAAAEERTAQARIATGVSLGVVLFVIIVGAGSAFALNKALDNRATIIDRAPDGSIKAIIKHGQIVYDSALGMGPITAAAGPDRLERFFLLLAMLRQMGQTGGEHTSPWQVYREYKQVVSPTLAHPLPASEEAALALAQGAQRARVDALAVKQIPRTTTRVAAAITAATTAATEIPGQPPIGSSNGLTHPAFQQPMPKLEIVDAVDPEIRRALELATGQA